MEILIAIFAGVIVFYAGWKAREVHAMRSVGMLLEEMNETMFHEFKSKVIDITVEKSGDFLYVYRKDNGTFLAQGTDMDKLSDILSEKFPGKLFNCSPEDLAALKATK